MKLYSVSVFSPSALAIGSYFVLLASVNANIDQEASQKPPEGPYSLQSWTHEPMYVDEPRWILLSPRIRGQYSSEETDDDNRFWVTRGKKRHLNSPRPATLPDSGVNLFVQGDDGDTWTGQGKKGTLSNTLNNDPFWVNRGKKEDVSTVLDQDPFWVNRGKRDVKGVKKKTSGVGEMLSQDPYWANRGKKGDLSSALGNGDQFWVNRGKKGDLESLLENGDAFWVNRGKKNELQDELNSGDQFRVNRGRRNELQSLLGGGDQFWVNRGKKDEIQSLLQSDDQFLVNRGKKNELQSLLEGRDQVWVDKRSNVQSMLEDQFWVNRGKKSELQSVLNGEDQNKRNDLQSVLNNGNKFWVNRGKKSELSSLLDSGDQFWVNTGKTNELQSMLDGGDQFWVNRGKKGDVQSLLGGGDQFWVNRGKKNDLQSVLNNGNKFWVNRGRKSELPSLLNRGDQFWVNRGKKNDLQSMLDGGDQFWVNRGKKSELQSVLNGGDHFWGNRGKKTIIGSGKDLQVNKLETNNGLNFEDCPRSLRCSKSGNSDPPFKTFSSPAEYWSGSVWSDRFRKDPLKMAFKSDPIFANRGKKPDLLDKEKTMQVNTTEAQSTGRPDERTKRQLDWGKEDKPLTSLFENAYWLSRGKKTNDGRENFDPFWVTRGKRLEMHNRKRRGVATGSTTKQSLAKEQHTGTVSTSPSQRQKRTTRSPRVASNEADHPYKKGDVNSLVIWWKSKPSLYDSENSLEDRAIEVPWIWRLGDNIPQQEPFWVNRGKKDANDFMNDEFSEDGKLAPEKRTGGEVPADMVSDLLALTQPAETFWVARG